MTGTYVLRSAGRRNAWIPDLSQIVFWVVYLRCLSWFFIEYDTFWHISTGAWIWNHKSIPRFDPGFAINSTPLPWQDNQWLAQIFLFGIWHIGGFFGLRIILGLIPSFIFRKIYLALREKGVNPLASFALVLLTANLTAHHWLARPHFLAYLCILASIHLWEKHRMEGQGYVWIALPLVQLVWVNLHQTFVAQFVFMGVFLTEGLARFIQEKDGKTFRRAARLSVLLFLMTFLNPHGIWVLHSPVDVWRIHRFISEWQPLRPSSEVFWYLLAYAFILSASLWCNRRKVKMWEPLLCLYSSVFVSGATRHVPIFTLATLSIFVRHVPALCGAISKRLRASAAKSLTGKTVAFLKNRNRNLHERELEFDGSRLTIAGFLILLCLSITGFHRLAPVQIWDGVNEEMYPVDACDFLEKESIAGNIFSDFAWGGYLIYRFRGRSKVFIDGRADMYGPDRMEEFYRIYRAESDWKELLKRYGINVMILRTSWKSADLLSKDPDWSLVYSEKRTSILVQTDLFPGVIKKYKDVTLSEAKEEDR